MSREEANKIIKMKEERKAARLAALNNGSVTTIRASISYNKDDDIHSSGNNSGNDSHEEEVDAENTTNVGSSSANQAHIGSSAVELPGFREFLTTRVRVDNGFISGKGQGKAL